MWCLRGCTDVKHDLGRSSLTGQQAQRHAHWQTSHKAHKTLSERSSTLEDVHRRRTARCYGTLRQKDKSLPHKNKQPRVSCVTRLSSRTDSIGPEEQVLTTKSQQHNLAYERKQMEVNMFLNKTPSDRQNVLEWVQKTLAKKNITFKVYYFFVRSRITRPVSTD